jgi:predicted small metal-binding protein
VSSCTDDNDLTPRHQGLWSAAKEDTTLAQQVKCECGYIARAGTGDEVLAKIRAHMGMDHPQLLDKISDDEIRGWIEVVA